MTLISTCCSGPVEAEHLRFAEGPADRLSVFKVRLSCEAAPGLGCGVKAKPILQSLGRLPGVEQTWLSRDGTMLAVVWAATADEEARDESVRSILGGHRVAARKLSGAARAAALRESAVDSRWCRGDGIDRLSEEESAIIAARLVQRVTKKVPFAEQKRQALSAAIAEACRHELIDRPLTSAAVRRRRIAAAVIKAGRKHLDGEALKALVEAAAVGHRPVGDEK